MATLPSPRAASAPRAPRADNRLSVVLDAAARLFAQRGYAATSMRDIAQAAAMLPGSLYYHFAAKEDLLAAVYEAGVREQLGGRLLERPLRDAQT